MQWVAYIYAPKPLDSAEGRKQNLCQPHGLPEAWAGAVIQDRSREVAVRQSWPCQPRCAACASRSYGTCCSASARGRCAAARVCRPVGRLPTSWHIGHHNGTRPPGRGVDNFTIPLYLLYLSTSFLWWQVVADIIGVKLSNTLRHNSRCTWRHREAACTVDNTALHHAFSPSHLCGSVTAGVHG